MDVLYTWTPVGGVNSTSQQVQYRVKGSSDWQVFATVGASTTTATITGLADNTIYEFRVVNICTIGGPVPTATKESIKITCPDFVLTKTFNSVIVTFTHLGGFIDAYEIRLLAPDDTLITAVTLTSPFSSPVSYTFHFLNSATIFHVRVVPKAVAYHKDDCAVHAITTDAAPFCSEITSEVINPVQSGPHNYFGAKITLDRFYDQDITVYGSVGNQGEGGLGVYGNFSLTIPAGQTTRQTENNVFMGGPTDIGEIKLITISPVLVTHDGVTYTTQCSLI